MMEEFDGLLGILTDIIDSVGVSAESSPNLVDGIPILGAQSTPWNATPSLDYMEDWDNDGIPNYADDFYGPGASSPLGSMEAPGEPNLNNLTNDGNIDIRSNLHNDHSDDNVPIEQHDFTNAGNNEEVLRAEQVEEDHLGVHSEDAVTIAGNPEIDGSYWTYQEGKYSCAVASQRGIIEEITGINISEVELAEFAESKGWYDPKRGTDPEALGNLLEAFGIDVERKYDTSFLELKDALDRGKEVIVGLDPNEIWNPETGPDGNPLEQPDGGHAVQVTGIKMKEDGGVNVVMNDTGIKDGRSKEVAIEDFLNAWADHSNFSVITQTGGLTNV